MITPAKYFFYEFENVKSGYQKMGIEYNAYIFDSLGIKKNVNLFKRLIPVFSITSAFLMIFYYLFIFLKKLFNPSLYWMKNFDSKDIKDNILCLCFTPLFLNRVSNLKFDCKEYTWIFGPNINNNLCWERKCLNYKKFMSLKDLCTLFCTGIKTCFIYMFKYNKFLIPIHKGPDYYLVYYSLKNITSELSLVFSNQSDRWAIMFDNLPAKKKILLQHGIDFPFEYLFYKLKTITHFYAISKSTWNNSSKYLLYSKPKLSYLEPTIKLVNIERRKFTILLISYFGFYNQEVDILSNLCCEDVDIYVKLHPTQSTKQNQLYFDLQKKYNFNIVEKSCFPMVDYVVSYFSTLAYEYEALGIAIHIYDKNTLDVNNMKNEIRELNVTTHVS